MKDKKEEDELIVEVTDECICVECPSCNRVYELAKEDLSINMFKFLFKQIFKFIIGILIIMIFYLGFVEMMVLVVDLINEYFFKVD